MTNMVDEKHTLMKRLFDAKEKIYYQNTKITALQNARTPEHKNSRTQNYRTPELQNSRTIKQTKRINNPPRP